MPKHDDGAQVAFPQKLMCFHRFSTVYDDFVEFAFDAVSNVKSYRIFPLPVMKQYVMLAKKLCYVDD